ncbi:MAG: hypothetical protein ACRDNK_24275 [Solirubrobacteraceae bacterium]
MEVVEVPVPPGFVAVLLDDELELLEVGLVLVLVVVVVVVVVVLDELVLELELELEQLWAASLLTVVAA